MRSLKRVLGSRSAQRATRLPFHELDSLHTGVLSRVSDQQALKELLRAHFFPQDDPYLPGPQRQIFSTDDHRYTGAVIRSCLADLSAIARFEREPLVFYHASLHDYLRIRDQSRSRGYFVDMRAFNAKIQPRLLELAEEDEKGQYFFSIVLQITKF